jgi:Ca2+/Na+ antiporter
MAMQPFEITLKNDKIKYYRFIALLLLLLNIAGYIFLLVAGIHVYEVATVLLVATLYVTWVFYKARKSASDFSINPLTFFILAAGWVAVQNYIAAFACIVSGILYRLSLQKLQFIFNDRFVKKITFPPKIYSWDMLDNVMLRDDILTIDLKNNKLIQLEVENKTDETQFNKFTKQQLSKTGFTEKTI